LARYFKPLGASALAAALAAGVTGRLDAQARQQIFLQYDGYVRIKGGSYVLAFGYFNLNNTDVPIAAGAANAFTPSPGDRNQPVVFVKGRHRFACTIVVDQNFDGRLQWSVAFTGKTSTTTAKTLDPLYELELNSEQRVLHGLELADAQPRRSKRHPLKMFNCRAKSVRNCQSPDAAKTTACRAAVR